MAEEGKALMSEMVQRFHMQNIVEKMKELQGFEENLMEQYPWMPAAYNRKETK